jgi:hypothetical protein
LLYTWQVLLLLVVLLAVQEFDQGERLFGGRLPAALDPFIDGLTVHRQADGDLALPAALCFTPFLYAGDQGLCAVGHSGDVIGG